MINDKIVILIVEDEEDLRAMYSTALLGAGFEVLQASDGIEALQLFEKKYSSIDLVLLDIVMPRMDGLEVLGKIKSDERFRKIPVIVSTNLDNDEDRNQSLSLGAKDYFVKSKHTPGELVEEIKTMLRDVHGAFGSRIV